GAGGIDLYPTKLRSRRGRVAHGVSKQDRALLPAKTRDAIGTQLRIVDRPAFLLHAISAKAWVRLHQRLVTLAVAHIALRRPRARPVARIKLRAVGYQLDP